jgi:cytochrome c5
MIPSSSPSRKHPHRILSLAMAGVAGLALAATGLRGAAPDAAPAAPAPAPAVKPAAAAPAAPAGKSPVFADVQPILAKYCYACHGGTLAPAGTAANSTGKSGLTLDTLENTLKGGRSKKPGIVAGKSAEGEILRRMQLDAAVKDVMPPKGKPVPTADEIKKLVDWVNAGAK